MRRQTTDLAGALSQIVLRTQGRRLAAIVLATDGQSTQPTSMKDAVDLARDRLSLPAIGETLELGA